MAIIGYNDFTVDCGVPQPPANGHIGQYQNTKMNSTVTYQCDDGYNPLPTLLAKCIEGGVWNPPPQYHDCIQVGKCVLIPQAVV